MKKNKYDFSGYATKVGLKCSDGRTIMQDAFQDNDGAKVPLVYQHLHNDPKNILGHAVLENRADGVYAYCSLNDTESGKTAKALIQHGDISALSIYANSLVEKSKNVIHGVIREVSLVIAGANPEAYIDNLAFQHGDGSAFCPWAVGPGRKGILYRRRFSGRLDRHGHTKAPSHSRRRRGRNRYPSPGSSGSRL